MVKVRKPHKVDLLDDVSWGELRKMKKKAAKAGGLIVYVDVKNYFGTKGDRVYCLGMIKETRRLTLRLKTLNCCSYEQNQSGTQYHWDHQIKSEEPLFRKPAKVIS